MTKRTILDYEGEVELIYGELWLMSPIADQDSTVDHQLDAVIGEGLGDDDLNWHGRLRILVELVEEGE